MEKLINIALSLVLLVLLTACSSQGADLTTDQLDPAYSPPVKTTAKPEQKQTQGCHPSYSGCLRADASDYDCAGGSGNGPYYTGKVRVIGPDVFGLDRDKDGWGCE